MAVWKATVDVYIQADTEEATYATMENIISHAQGLDNVELVVYGTGGFEEQDNDPRCVCGVYKSEHQLCGCGEWERAR